MTKGALGWRIIRVCIDGVGNVNSTVSFEGIDGVSIQQMKASHVGHDPKILISLNFAAFSALLLDP